MNHDFLLSRQHAALLLIDVQEKLIPFEERAADVLAAIQKVIKGFQILGLPIIVTEQYPEGLGSTIAGLKSLLGDKQLYFPKTTFSCLGSPSIAQAMAATGASQWVLAGIEAHVCVLQTAKSLLHAGKEVVVLNDATSSRSIYDFSTAMAQLRDIGVSISSVEAVLFELLSDSQAPEFKKISQLLK